MKVLPEIPFRQDLAAPKTILVVDDDLYIRELNAGALIGSGYKVVTAVDGAEAWAVLKIESFDLLITDHKMPKVTGVELIKKLRSEEMNLPVILASGTMPTEELERHPGLNVDATLAKPFTIEELLNTVKNVLRAVEDATKSSQLFRDCALMDNAIAQDEKPVKPIPGRINPSPRILVVDDDNDMRQFSISMLTDSGYHAEGVKDGAAGWAALQANNYDLVVTDNKMPNMTGLEMIAKLRSSHMTVRVIMATGILPTNEFARKPWLRPDASLQRPFSQAAFLEMVKKVLHSGDGDIARLKRPVPMNT
jgi:DNA-binding response OmpR family regulator